MLEGKRESAPPSFRPIALSYASRLILERIGVWPVLMASAIETVQASQLGGFGRTRLSACDAGVPALGYVVDYAGLASALRARLDAAGVERLAHGASADVGMRCEVHAEGSASDAVEKRYTQHAIVALVRLDAPAGTTAYERFTPHGPLALLPMGGRYAVIWSTQPAHARILAECADGEFLRQLSANAGHRLGKPLEVEARSTQPLVSRVRAARVAPRAVYIGNAAQTLHPVAGQGLNLGLRDAWDLAQILRDAPDPGTAGILAEYASQRRIDAAATFRITDLLARAFLGEGRIAGAARGLALTALDILPGPRRFFARRMIYGPSALP
jgi:2-octaprenyl-6-methoxyphenol hydroxylase